MLTRWTQEDAYDKKTMDCELYAKPGERGHWDGVLTMSRGPETREIPIEFYDLQDYEMFCKQIEDEGGIYGVETEGMPICWDSGVE